MSMSHRKGSAPSSSSSSLLASKKLLLEKDQEIVQLQARCSALSQQLQSTLLASAEKKRRHHHPLSPHAVNVREVLANSNTNGGTDGLNSNGSSKRVGTIHSQRERIGRTASIATRRVLDTLIQQQQLQNIHLHSNRLTDVVQRVLEMFSHPTQHMEYLNSQTFAKDLLKLCKAVKGVIETEPRVVFLQSPCYVFGDIHGNLEDLHFFSDNIWRLGMGLTAGNFLFLGDYVGTFGVVCFRFVAPALRPCRQNGTSRVGVVDSLLAELYSPHLTFA
jgi:hypothetical protein